MDLYKGFLTALYNIYTTDSQLQNIMGSVRVNFSWAMADEEFPYIIHRFAMAPIEPWGLRSATYMVDLWDYGDTADRLFEIRNRVITLLDERVFSIDQNGSVVPFGSGDNLADAVRLYLDNDEPLNEETQNIWRHHFSFTVRLGRSGEIRQILARGE